MRAVASFFARLDAGCTAAGGTLWLPPSGEAAMKILPMLLLVLFAGGCAHVYDDRYDDRYRYGKDHSGPGPGGQDRVLVCHKGKKTMELPAAALQGHLGHGDYRGPCR